MFGAPNGLCSSMTEAKHIKTVKEPWQQSSHFDALEQMLLTNQCLDKLAAAQVDFTSCGMLDGTVISSALQFYGMSHLSFNYLTEVFSADDLPCDDDTHAQDSHFDGEPATPSSSTAPHIDKSSETWPVNNPLAIAEVVLAKTPCTFICTSHPLLSLTLN
jgi:hypothetical protein